LPARHITTAASAAWLRFRLHDGKFADVDADLCGQGLHGRFRADQRGLDEAGGRGFHGAAQRHFAQGQTTAVVMAGKSLAALDEFVKDVIIRRMPYKWVNGNGFSQRGKIAHGLFSSRRWRFCREFHDLLSRGGRHERVPRVTVRAWVSACGIKVRFLAGAHPCAETSFSTPVPSQFRNASCGRNPAKDAAKLSLTRENSRPILWDTGPSPQLSTGRRHFPAPIQPKKESLMKRLLAIAFLCPVRLRSLARPIEFLATQQSRQRAYRKEKQERPADPNAPLT
jgi:hypothetical protein